MKSCFVSTRLAWQTWSRILQIPANKDSLTNFSEGLDSEVYFKLYLYLQVSESVCTNWSELSGIATVFEGSFWQHTQNCFYFSFCKATFSTYYQRNIKVYVAKYHSTRWGADMATGSELKTTLRPLWLHSQMHFTTVLPSDSNKLFAQT